MSSTISWTSILARAGKAAGTSYGQELVGKLTQPVFGNLEKHLIEEMDSQSSGSSKGENPFVNALNWLRYTFSWGDLISLGGLGAWIFEAKYLKSEGEEGLSGFKKALKAVTIGITVGGSLTAIIGRVFGLHRAIALGERYAEWLLSDAERKGKKIFTELSQGDKDKLKEKTIKLNRTLVYKRSVEKEVLARHKDDKIGGLFDGPPGTGKTVGVECILGNWIEKVEKEGKEPVVAKLNLANFNEYIKEQKDQAKAKKEFVQAAERSFGNFEGVGENHGLMVLQLLVKKIQKLKDKVAAHNQGEDKKQELAVFVDEFDKVFDPSTLKGCDKARLGTLLSQFNDLYVQENLLLTSNLSLEDIIKTLKKHLYVDDENTGEQIWGPVQSRMETNRVYIGLASQNEQAQILAGYLLEEFSEKLDLESFGVDKGKLNGNIVNDRAVLGAVLYYHLFAGNSSINLSPRHIGEGVTKRIRRTIDDSGDNARITKDIVVTAVKDQMENRRDISDTESRNQIGYSVLDKYIGTDGFFEKIKDKAKQLKGSSGQIDILKLLEAIYTKKETKYGAVYESNSTVQINGKHYCHSIIFYNSIEKDGISSEPQVRIDFAECNSGNKVDQMDRYDFYPTEQISLKEFKAKIAPKIMHAAKDPSTDLLKSIFDGLVELSMGRDPDILFADFAQKLSKSTQV